MENHVINVVLELFFLNSIATCRVSLWIKVNDKYLFLILAKTSGEIDYRR